MKSDIVEINDLGHILKDQDPQLDKAIEEALKLVKKQMVSKFLPLEPPDANVFSAMACSTLTEGAGRA